MFPIVDFEQVNVSWITSYFFNLLILLNLLGSLFFLRLRVFLNPLVFLNLFVVLSNLSWSVKPAFLKQLYFVFAVTSSHARGRINFIEITLRYGCFPVNLLHIFRTPFSKNTSGRLHLTLGGSLNFNPESLHN